MSALKSIDTPPPLRLAWLVWGVAALFYLMAFFHRVAPAVMTEELMREFSISAGALGNLAAFYFYSYAAMQVPTGVLADIWGPRRLLSAGAFVAAIGTLIFSFAPTVFWACAGRLLIGGAVAVAFVGMLKLTTCWFPPRYFAMVSGMAVLIGNIGAIFAGTPLRLLMDQYSWRNIMLIVALMTAGIGLAIWLFVRDYPYERGYANVSANACVHARPSPKAILAGILDVFRYRNTRLLMLIPGSMTGSVITFAGLWGVPYLTTHYGLPAPKAALLTSGVMVALALGSPFFGWLSDRWGKRKPLFIMGCALALASFSIALFIPRLPFYLLASTLFLAGFSASSLILTFALAKESVPEHLSGTISGVANMGVMIGPMLLQPAVGWMLDRQWQGQMQAGIRVYGLDAYRAGFAIMMGWMTLSLLLLFFIRETNCKQMRGEDESRK